MDNIITEDVLGYAVGLYEGDAGNKSRLQPGGRGPNGQEPSGKFNPAATGVLVAYGLLWGAGIVALIP